MSIQNGPMALLVLTTFQAAATGLSAPALGQPAYDYRQSDHYRQLAVSDRRKIDQVDRDLMLLERALNRYRKDHATAPPALSDLVPRYLKSLPRDPFATMVSVSSPELSPRFSRSLAGWGYQYRGLGRSGWVVRSVGMPKFPYRSRTSTVGLSRSGVIRHGFILDVF